ncbi:hypothetical protein GBK04_09305 [Cytophagaceae bacterium SJW1-29]|uniref:Uncharacterized protein n=1 Tax=Salmonirosea aquatica TaxID=2654236 RepID=A0A7C9BH35_9BACT|nr:hypothetical protein [Cytophagaceae bacterium SJW1-29]
MSSVSGLWTQSDRLWNPGVAIDQIQQYFGELQESMEAQSNEANAKFMDDLFDSVQTQMTADVIRISAIIMLIYESLTLFGAYLMWGLQKRGFYYYVAGVGIAIVASLLLIGGWLGFMTMLGEAFFSIIFIFLYRSQLKYMV